MMRAVLFRSQMSKRQFANWIKERIDLYDFKDGIDFVINKFVTQYNQVDRIDYALTLDMAKDRISQFDFTENQDFVVFSGNSEKGRPSKDYYLTLDMAKELSMVERNDKGKKA